MILHSLIRSVKHVWSMDPALDRSDLESFSAAWESFLKDGDLAKLPIKEGETPTVFTLEPLTRSEFVKIYGGGDIERVIEAVAYGLQSVENLMVNGEKFQIERIESGGSKRVKGSCLDAFFDPVLFAELGTRIVEISRLHPTSG